MKRLIPIFLVTILCGLPNVEAAHKSPVKVSAGLDKSVVLADSEEKIVVKVGVSADSLDLEKKRLPMNIAIVLDKSGSMASGQKIENAKQGAIEIVQRLNRNDILSVIVYDSAPRVIFPAQPLKNKDTAIELISSIRADGSTALYGGVTLGAAEIGNYLSGEHLNRIILLSDGLANVGPQSTEELAELGFSLQKEGISVTTIGVGLDYNEDLMTALAQEGGGNAYFAYNSKELPEIFAEEIGEAMTTVAKNVKIHLDCFEGVDPITIIGRKGDTAAKQMTVEIGTLYGANEKYALFELAIAPKNSEKVAKIARVRVEYFDPFSKRTQRQEKIVSLTWSRNKQLIQTAKNKSIIKEVSLTKASEIKRKAIKLAEQGKYDLAGKLLKDSSLELEKSSKQCDNDSQLQEEAANCDKLAKEVNTNKRFSKGQRKQIMSDSQSQMYQQTYSSKGMNY